jgi:hypothetical protein
MRIFNKRVLFLPVLSFFVIFGCNSIRNDDVQDIDRIPEIDPDYSGVTIPPNISPMNFVIQEEGHSFKIDVISASDNSYESFSSSDGIVKFSKRSWRKLLEKNRGGEINIQISSIDRRDKSVKKYKPFSLYIAKEEIDPYLSYRLMYPGYIAWYTMKIVQRSLETFREEAFVENQILDNNCINCHSFDQYNPERFFIHVRGSKGDTYFIDDGRITRITLKTEDMPLGATYPAWHPDGRYVIFTSSKVLQSFDARPDKNIRCYDLLATLILYDTAENEVFYIKESDSLSYYQTFPGWSPDGRYLYFCMAKKINEEIDVESIETIHYNLVRKPFDSESGLFGETEIVYDAAGKGKSVSFPRISPDGNYLVFTLHDYGTFPIWYKEADLYLLDLRDGNCMKMSINSDDSESYHSWSSNGKWLVFSSKRRDGLSAFPYFAWFGSPGKVGKPFVLPQKDPTVYNRMTLTYNIPEFIKGRIKIKPRDFEKASKEQSVIVKTVNPGDAPPGWMEITKETNNSAVEHGNRK